MPSSVNGNGRPALARINQENYSPSTPLIRKSRPLPGPSPLSLKRSASFGNNNSSDRPRKRRTRSSDIVFQKRVTTLLEQAQSMYKSDDKNVSPHSDDQEDTANEFEFAFDGDLDMLEAELQFDPLSSDGIQKMDADITQKVHVETNSDDLFDNDFDFNPEELEALDLSSNNPTTSVSQDAQETMDEDEVLFGDGYDELMDLDFEEPQPEVYLS